jgi:peptide/nickel transport system ATP-binding protein
MTVHCRAGSLLLEAQGVSVEYAGTPAVSDFSLRVGAGEFVGLMGQPGCGKSTAVLALLGLTRGTARITSGQIVFQGTDLLTLSAAQLSTIRGARIGLVTQSPRAALHPMLTVGAQLSNVYRAHSNVGRRAARDHALEMLRLVGIHEPERRFGAYAHELSTGMAQRVVIAMALTSQPDLLVADEPTSGLDVTIQAQVLDQLWDAAGQLGSAVLLVTQDLGIVANYCNRVAIMQSGTIVEDRTVPDFFAQPRHEYSRSIVGLYSPGVGELDTSQAGFHNRAALGAAALLQVRGLRKEFPVAGHRQPIAAVDDVEFDLLPGECVGLVGESGSGKTTIGRCVLRLEESTAGEIHFAGQPVHSLAVATLRPLRERMQIVFQDPLDSMDPRWTVEQVVRQPLELLTSLSETQKEQRIVEMMEATGLSPALRRELPRGLSAGVQQRIAVARAMMTRPDFVVLDEPTSALTPETTVELLELLKGLQRQFGPAYLFISHDLTTIRHVCDRVIVLYLGQVVEEGTTAQIFDSPRHPYTRALIAAHLAPTPQDRRVDRAERPALRGEIAATQQQDGGCYLAPRCPSVKPRCRVERQALVANVDGRRLRCWRALEEDL